MNEDMLAELERDAEKAEFRLPDDDKVRRIGALAQRQLELEADIETTQAQLAALQVELDEVRDRTLSDLLLGCGVAELKLANGRKVRIDKLVFASIKGDARKAAIAWLEAHKFGALVKYKVEVDVGKGETETYRKVLDTLEAFGIEAKEKADVHPQTLKAFVAEQLAAGADLPQGLFGVHVINRCKIT